jgi:hypothetical protein
MYNEKYIIEQYNKGNNTNLIAKELGTYNTTIRRILLRNNITLRNVSEANSKVKFNVFQTENEETFYWFGFLAADGYVGNKENTIGLGLQEKDLDHLIKYSKYIGVDVKSYKNKKFNVIEHKVYFKNKKINSFLKSIGITENKSNTLCLKIPLNFHILRGIIDGDGYVRKNKPTVEIATNSIDFANQIKEFLNNNNIHCTVNYNNICIIGIYKKKDVTVLYNELYKDASVFLERKKDRLTALLFGNI